VLELHLFPHAFWPRCLFRGAKISFLMPYLIFPAGLSMVAFATPAIGRAANARQTTWKRD
jgi:hypothetical protein